MIAALAPTTTRAAATAAARPARWIQRAWRRLGWRQVALAALLGAMFPLIGPNGGGIFYPGVPVNDPFVDLLGCRWLCTMLPIVFAVMVADEAYDDGVGAVGAYAVALVVGAFLAGFIDAWTGIATGWWNRAGSPLPSPFRLKASLLQGGLFVAVYAYWRTTQRALRRVQAAEAERVVGRQRLLAARLMALQARVEPQFLFDALSRIGAMHEREPRTADAMLADLIALLRAMLPLGSAATSTVAREFALAEAWLRVQRHLGASLDVSIAASPLAAQSGLGAMLVLPLLQDMLALPGARAVAWRLDAEPVATAEAMPRVPRLRIRLAPEIAAAPAAGIGAAPATTATSERLRERLAELHGDAATLAVHALPDGLASFVLELPFVEETGR